MGAVCLAGMRCYRSPGLLTCRAPQQLCCLHVLLAPPRSNTARASASRAGSREWQQAATKFQPTELHCRFTGAS